MPKKKNNTRPRKTKEVLLKDRYEKWTNAKTKEILDCMMLDFLRFKINYNYKNNRTFGQDHSPAVFTIQCNKTYRQANIIAYPEAYNMYCDGDLNVLVDGLVHELCHLHTIKLAQLAENRFTSQDQIRDEVEDVTETLAEYVRRLFAKTQPQIFINKK